MLYSRRWQTGPLVLVLAGMATSAIAPFAFHEASIAAPRANRVAQLFPPNGVRVVAIPAGTRLPVRYDNAEKIVVAPDETVPLTLKIDRNIRDRSGRLLIPAGSEVKGELRPVENGSQFFAETLVFPSGQQLPIDAESAVVSRTEEVQPGANTDAILKGAAIGAGAATLISGILGNKRITLGKILAGAGAGALGGLIFGKRRAEVIVINPNTDLDLILQAPLELEPSYSFRRF